MRTTSPQPPPPAPNQGAEPASPARPHPLEGLRILELGQLIAGPFATMLLAWFGADVIKVEPPAGGDPLRTWRQMHHGTSLWWYIMGRNKRSVTADLRTADARDLVRRLVVHCDVVLENFKPGRLEAWGLGYEELRRINPKVIMVRLSGWGQTGPYANKPGYASVAEGIGGLRYVNGHPDRPPARANLSLGDTIGGLHAALGILAAVYNRDVGGSGRGQVVDVALFEAIFNMMESTLPEYTKYGAVRERQGSTVSGIVPTNTYPCKDGTYLIIGGNGDSIFKRLMRVAGRPDMADDPRFARNDGRVQHQQEIDAAIAAWASQCSFDEALAALEAAQVPAGPIYSIADQVKDPHFAARGLIEEVSLPDGDRVTLPRLAPVFSETPGGTRWPGPPLGAHNEEVYGELLGLSRETLDDLKARGVI
ncbi:MAG: CoA transferase [Luteitalea sp.]|nr:CoA transferase [Luteitalea sp.]